MPDQPPPLSGDGRHSRRQLLKAAGILGLVGGLGIGGLYWDSGESPTESSLPDGIPGAAEFVANGEPRNVLSDGEFSDAIDAELTAQEVDVVSDLNGFLGSVTETTGIDPREFGTTTVFGAATGPASGVGAVIFEANFDSVRELLAGAGVLAEVSEYGGYDLYAVEIEGSDTVQAESGDLVGGDGEPISLVVSELGDGEFAFGTRREIEGVIDIRKGNRPGLDRTLSKAVESVEPGDLRVGFLVPATLFSVLGLPEGASQLVDLDKLEYGYGAADGGELTVTIRAASSNAAGDLGSQLTSVSRILTASGESGIVNFPPEIKGQLLDVLSGVEIETEGRRVTVTVPDGYRLTAIVIVAVVRNL